MSVVEDIKARLGDRWWRLNHLYKIENEKGELVPFVLRPAQQRLLTQMWWLNLILKARQMGFSTGIDIFLLDEALFNANLKCGIIAQDKTSAGEIFRTKVEVPFDNLPSWLKRRFRVLSRRSGASGGYILFGHQSSIQVGTSFRSGTVQRLHISEHGKICAKYPEKAREVRTGTLNTIHPDCIAFIESTAEGVGGDFHSMTMRALALSHHDAALSRMDWKFHFFPWWQEPKYQLPVPTSGLVLSRHHMDYFIAIERAANTTLSDEQKQWYIQKEAEQREEMKQEFPSTPIEAFLVSGRRVFSATDTMHAEAHCEAPILLYDMEPQTGRRTKSHLPTRLDAQGQQTLMNRLLIWELPDDEDYAMGIDIAEGLEHGDRSSIDVVKRSTGEQVAHWFGYLDVERLAMLTAHIAQWYRNAFVGPERNNHGHAFILKLKELYPPSRIYAEQLIDRDSEDETERLGWLTTRHSKPILTEGLKSLLSDQQSGIRWVGTVSEIHTFVYDARGSMNAQEGCYDDQLMSYMIAQEMRVRMPVRRPSDELPTRKAHWMTH
ncbi:terminase [Vibrio penaeicida]|uniref:terminase n=1 Tax=Vibrio penaeicida TaxID=104609 RepID=UPI000CE9CB36|nr:terminase [Vibrio penaeicida]